MANSLIKLCGASAAAVLMEITGLVPAMQTTQPTNPTPRPTTLPTPTTPRQPTNQQPTNPNSPVDPNNPANPNAPANPNNPANANSAARMRLASPFSFQSPQMEARFTESNRRLIQLEQQLNTSNQDLLRRLGAARQLTGERQSTAMFDIVQQILQNNAQMQQYLAQSRQAWAGDMEGLSTDTNTLPGTTPGSTLPGTTPGNTLPGTTPGNTVPSSPGTQPPR